jgi:hypothetical protein
MIAALRVSTSGAWTTVFTSSNGMPGSRSRRITWALGTCDGAYWRHLLSASIDAGASRSISW